MSLADFLDNTTPWAKQEEAFDFIKDRKLGALLMQQRTGKAVVSIGVAAYRYEILKAIDAVLVVAMPGGVPQNWADEIDGNMAEGTLARFPSRIPHKAIVWNSEKANTVRFKTAWADALGFKGLLFVCMNGEALITANFRRMGLHLLKRRKLWVIADETSLLMKAPGKRANVMEYMKKYAEWRTILDGTPADESPFDLYTPFHWLSPAILGHATFSSFKTYHGEWEERLLYDRPDTKCFTCFGHDKNCERCHGTNKVPASFKKLKNYRNLPQLQDNMYSVSFRVLRSECFDIPDKLYAPYHFDLTAAQRKVYDEMAEEYETELPDGLAVSAPMVLTRYLRLQQIGSNYWPSQRALAPCPDCCVEEINENCSRCDGIGAYETRTPERVIDPKENPRLDALKDVNEASFGDPLIVWARFTSDIDRIMSLGERLGMKPVRYDGLVSKEQKRVNKATFQRGEAGWFVANEGSAERGLNLGRAKSHVFFSNEFSGLKRTQSEDRTETIGRERGTGVIDLIARGTVDEDITLAHHTKRSIAAIVMERPKGQRFIRSKGHAHRSRLTQPNGNSNQRRF